MITRLSPHGRFLIAVRVCASMVLLSVLAPNVFAGHYNPNDPANWDALPVIHNGQDNWYRREREVVNGQSQLVSVHYKMVWSTGLFYRNGLLAERPMFPFSKAIPESDTVSANSSGTVTYRFQWNKGHLEAPPASLRLDVASVVQAYYGEGGSGSVSNGGLGGNETVAQGLVTPYCRSLSYRRTVAAAVNGQGIAEFVISTQATAEDFGGENEPAVADTSCHGGTAAIDGRWATIVFDAIYKKKNLPTTTTIAIPSNANVRHDVFVANPVHNFTYPNAETVLFEVNWNHSGDSGQYVIAQDFNYFNVIWGPQLDLSNNAPRWQVGRDRWLTFYAHVASHHNPGEEYAWSTGQAGVLPNASGGFVVPNSHRLDKAHVFIQIERLPSLFSAGQKYFHVNHDEDEVVPISLTYKWTDGFEYTSSRVVVIRKPREDIAQSGLVEHETEMKKPVEFQVYGGRVPAGTTSANAIFKEGFFSRKNQSQSVLVVGALSAAVGGVGALGGLPMLEFGAGVATAAGISAEWVDNGEIVHEVDQNVGGVDFTWWELNGFTHTVKPDNSAWNTWSWSLSIRQLQIIRLTAYDKYTTSGFVGRWVDEDIADQKPDQWRRLITCYKNTSQESPDQ